MPSFPSNGADMTREDALTMIIASIAMEELALSHILNAEGEKLQYILGTLPGTKPCAGPQEVLAVNKSVTALVETVTQNQMLLKNKLDRVLEFCPLPPPPPPGCPEPCPPPCPPPWGPKPCPCPPPCGPEPCPPLCPPPCRPEPCSDACPEGAAYKRSALQLTGQREGMLWNPCHRLPWRQQSRTGEDVRWDERTSTQIRLNPKKTYLVQYTLNVCAMSPEEETASILLRQSPCGVFTETLPLHVSTEHPANGPQTLQYTAVLHPRMCGGREAELSLVLEAAKPLCVEQAALNVAEL